LQKTAQSPIKILHQFTIMRKIYLLCCLCLFTTLCFAQSNFKHGFIVNLKGDTVRGFIDYQEWDSPPRSITFQGPVGESKRIYPTEVAFINIDGHEAFQSYTGRVSNDQTFEDRVAYGRDTSYTIQTIFLKLLQKGKVISLYSYSDEVKQRYFFSTPADKTIKELVYRVYFDDNRVNSVKGIGRTVNENTYAQQLTSVALSAGVLDDKLQRYLDQLSYNKPRILEVTTKMNGLTKADLAKNAPAAKPNFDIYVGAGLSIISTKPHNKYATAGGKAYTSYLPKAVIGVSTYANPNTRKLVFSAELAAGLGKYQSVYDNKIYPYIGLKYGFDQLIVSITPQISYNLYNADSFKFFLAIGFDLSFCTYFNKVYAAQDGSPVDFALNPFQLDHVVNSGIFKVGVLAKKQDTAICNLHSGRLYFGRKLL